MATGMVHGIASGILRFRRGLLWLLLLLAALSAWLAPTLRVDPSPKGLVSSFGDQEQALSILRDAFFDSDHVVFVLVEASDVMTREVLEVSHAVTRQLAAMDEVEDVFALTADGLAYRLAAPRPMTLAALEEDDFGLEVDGLTGDTLAAVEALVAADPGRFPSLAAFEASTDLVERWEPPEALSEEDVAALRLVVEQTPALTGTLVGRPAEGGKRTVLAVVASVPTAAGNHQRLESVVQRVNDLLETLEAPNGVTLRATGLPHVWAEMVSRMESDQRVLLPLTLCLCLALLWLSYRWWPFVVLPGITVLLSAGLFVVGMVLADIPLNVLNNVVPALLVFIGISDAIHLVARYRHELGRGLEPLEAMRHTLQAMLPACFLTSLTTALGLLTLAGSETALMRSFGVSAALGVMGAFFVTVVFLPVMLLCCPRPPAEVASGLGRRVEETLRRLTPRLLRRRYRTLAVALTVTLLSSLAVTRVQVDTKLRDQFAQDDPIVHAIEAMDRSLAGVRPLEVLFTAEEDLFQVELLDGLFELARFAETKPSVLAAVDPGAPYRELYALLAGDASLRGKPLTSQDLLVALAKMASLSEGGGQDEKGVGHRFGVSKDRRTLRLQIRVADVGALETMALIEAVRVRAKALVADRDVRVILTGDAFTGSVPVQSVATDMLRSLALAVVAILLLLAGIFRSLRVGVLAAVANALPLLVTLGWMVLRSIPLTIGTAVTFSIAFGLAVDGTIHMVARIREEQGRGNDLVGALTESAAATGGAIAVSSAALFLGFGAFALSGFVPIRQFGELIAVTTVVCFAATVLVQPALFRAFLPQVARGPGSSSRKT